MTARAVSIGIGLGLALLLALNYARYTIASEPQSFIFSATILLGLMAVIASAFGAPIPRLHILLGLGAGGLLAYWVLGFQFALAAGWGAALSGIQALAALATTGLAAVGFGHLVSRLAEAVGGWAASPRLTALERRTAAFAAVLTLIGVSAGGASLDASRAWFETRRFAELQTLVAATRSQADAPPGVTASLESRPLETELAALAAARGLPTVPPDPAFVELPQTRPRPRANETSGFAPATLLLYSLCAVSCVSVPVGFVIVSQSVKRWLSGVSGG